jgi:hypothetical protein
VVNKYTGSDVGKGGLEVTEIDGAPDARGVSKIIVSNGSITDVTGGAVTITTGGGGGGGLVMSGSTANGVLTYSNATTAVVSTVTTFDGTDFITNGLTISDAGLVKNLAEVVVPDGLAINASLGTIFYCEGNAEFTTNPTGSGQIVHTFSATSIDFTPVGGIQPSGANLIQFAGVGNAVSFYDSPSIGGWIIYSAANTFTLV